MITALAHSIGATLIEVCTLMGRFVLFFINTLKTAFTTRLKLKKLFAHMNEIGVESTSIVVLTGISTGMVFALQAYIGFQRVGGEQFLGAVVALGMIRELGPVLTGLMITGRAGSAMAAEIGTMSITEQLDALRTLRINIFQYLVVPRILASVLIVPCMTIIAMMCGIIGGYVTAVHVLQLSPEDYTTSIRNFVELSDVTRGLTKSAVFGLILSWVGTCKGFYTHNGARGVGISTTQSVVLSSILILVSNYFLTKLLEHL